MTKTELRAMYLEKRRSLSVGDIAAVSNRIAERFFAEIDLTTTRKFHTFIRIAKFNEIDTSNIYYRIWQERRDIATYAPVSDVATGDMESLRFDADTELFENAWGIREPVSSEKAEPEEFDLVIVPLLCFDLFGQRVGYGKGMYDKFLSGCRSDCLKVGLSHFPPVEIIDNVSDTDITLDICLTPERSFHFNGSSDLSN